MSSASLVIGGVVFGLVLTVELRAGARIGEGRETIRRTEKMKARTNESPELAEKVRLMLRNKHYHRYAGCLATGLAPCVMADPTNLDQWIFNEHMKASGWPLDGYRYEPVWFLRIANPFNAESGQGLALVRIQVSHADSDKVIAAAESAGFVMRPDFDPTPFWLDESESRNFLEAMGLSPRQVIEKIEGPRFEEHVQAVKAEFVSRYGYLRALEVDRRELLEALEHRDRNGYTVQR